MASVREDWTSPALLPQAPFFFLYLQTVSKNRYGINTYFRTALPMHPPNGMMGLALVRPRAIEFELTQILCKTLVPESH